MYLKLALCVLLTYIQSVYNDFVVGMFQPQDYLVAQDTIFRERIPYRSVKAQYGRKFKCPITYFRVIDRLGVGRGPGVRIVRGGLTKPHIVVTFTSTYNMPLSLNIYAGCQNKLEKPTFPPSTNSPSAQTAAQNSEAAANGGGTDQAGSQDATTSQDGPADGASPAAQDADTPAPDDAPPG